MSDPTLETALDAWVAPDPPDGFADRVLAAAHANAAPRDLRARLGRAKRTGAGTAPPPRPFRSTAPTAHPSAPMLDAPPSAHDGTKASSPPAGHIEVDELAPAVRPWRRALMLAVAALVAVGLGLGFAGGSASERRAIYNRTVRDARAVHGAIEEASGTLEAAQRAVGRLTEAARGNEAAGTPPHVDSEAIDALRRLEVPFEAAQFTTRSYAALPPGVVDDLFEYLMKVQEVWDRIGRLTALGTMLHRQALDRVGTAQGDVGVGAIPMRTEDGRLVAGLAFITAGVDEEGTPVFLARASRAGREVRVSRYTGAEELDATPRYVVPIDPAASRFVLHQGEDDYDRYFALVAELGSLLAETIEVQGRLLSAIGAAATLETT